MKRRLFLGLMALAPLAFAQSNDYPTRPIKVIVAFGAGNIDYAYRYDAALLEGVTTKRNLLVFDFGGGTCDIALFELSRPEPGGPVKVASRSVSRFHRLGGGDVDLAVLHRVLVPQLLRENGLDDFALSFQEKTRVVTPALIAVAEALKLNCYQKNEAAQRGQRIFLRGNYRGNSECKSTQRLISMRISAMYSVVPAASKVVSGGVDFV